MPKYIMLLLISDLEGDGHISAYVIWSQGEGNNLVTARTSIYSRQILRKGVY